jgi:alkylation response protein AidB-like acyl-CoA dehydrogenase
MAVTYAGIRRQFGRPIGSFQAIKHMLANAHVEIECARATAFYAAWSLDALHDDPAELADLCLTTCSDAFLMSAKENIQVHGAIACTWEHDAHLYLRRAMAARQLLGTPRAHRERMASRLLAANVTVSD